MSIIPRKAVPPESPSTTYPFYLSDIFEWLRNPSNEFHVQFELDWMVSLLAVIFHRFLLRLLSTSKDEIEEVLSLGSLDSSYSDLISPLLSLIDRKVLNKIRLHPDECEYRFKCISDAKTFDYRMLQGFVAFSVETKLVLLQG